MLDLNVTAPDLQPLILDLAATEKQVQRALNSTLRKMATWLRARSVKGLSKELQMQQKILRRRLKSARLRMRAGGSEITVWFGLNPVAMIYLKAKQSASGVTAQGGRYVKGAFIAGKGARKGWQLGGAVQVFKRRGAERLPIDKQESEVQHPAEGYLRKDALGAAFDAQFFKTFEHELQWQTR